MHNRCAQWDISCGVIALMNCHARYLTIDHHSQRRHTLEDDLQSPWRRKSLMPGSQGRQCFVMSVNLEPPFNRSLVILVCTPRGLESLTFHTQLGLVRTHLRNTQLGRAIGSGQTRNTCLTKHMYASMALLCCSCPWRRRPVLSARHIF